MTDEHLNWLQSLLQYGDPGPYEAHMGFPAPAEACRFGVVSRSKGMEVCRIWEEGEARLYEALRNDAAEIIRLARIGLQHDKSTSEK